LKEAAKFVGDFKSLAKEADLSLAKHKTLELDFKRLLKAVVKAAKFVGDFKSLAKEADLSLAKHKTLELDFKRLLKAVVSQDIISIVQNASVVVPSDLQTELERTKEHFENCIIKKETEYAKLWNDWYKKCDACKYDKISYDKAYKDMQQKIERLQAQLGDLKGKCKDSSYVSDTQNQVFQKLENANVELEFQEINEVILLSPIPRRILMRRMMRILRRMQMIIPLTEMMMDEQESSRDYADDEEEDKDEDEEEYLALVDFVPPPAYRTTTRMSIRAQKPLPFLASMVMMRVAAPSTYILAPRSETPLSGTPQLLPIPLPTSSPSLLLRSTDYRADVLEVTLPPQKRLYIAIGPKFEIEKCSFAPTARPTGGFRADYGFVGTLDAEIRHDPDREIGYEITDVWEDLDEVVEEILATDVAELSQRMTNFVTTIRQDTYEIYRKLDDAQDNRLLMSGQLNSLRRDRRSHARTARLIECNTPKMGRSGILSPGRVMDAPTIPVSAEENLGDLINIRVDIIHLEPDVAVTFPAASVEELMALRFKVEIAEAENASLRVRIKTMEAIKKITRNSETSS
nr:hypothetical protein [Tanacetum cinerariifolium]